MEQVMIGITVMVGTIFVLPLWIKIFRRERILKKMDDLIAERNQILAEPHSEERLRRFEDTERRRHQLDREFNA